MARRAAQAGFTLVEVMVAGSVLALLVCALLEGVIVASRIARENSEALAADAFAFDLAWMKFNEDYMSLRLGTTTYNVSENVPVLSRWPNATAQTYVYTTNNVSGKFISARVTWGPDNSRSVQHTVLRGPLTRVVTN